MEKEQTIIGTAGHIDHGKTALVKALTGFDTDTLAEEKKRGITIELGFAFMEAPDFDKQIVFIDVPGHEKLIKTMVAGASNIDVAMLVIAADEGINVQTIEHFDILQLLGIEIGIVALNKADLVDEARLRNVAAEVRSLTAGTFLADAPIIPVSSITGIGVNEVKAALIIAARGVKSRRDTGVFRMPIDRVFTMHGFGTVVAGTILSGSVKIGDRLEILPDGITSKVRGIQVHSKSVESSQTGRRTAINLQDVKKELLRRGQCICAPGSMIPTNRLDARLHVLKSLDDDLKNRERVRLHIGTDEVICRAVLLDSDKLSPGQSGLVQFVLEAPTTALPKDRFVIRTFSSMRTIGGGTILDSLPYHHKRHDPTAKEALARLEGGISDTVEQAFVKSRNIPQTAAEISSLVGEEENPVEKAVDDLFQSGKLVQVTQTSYLHKQNYDELVARLISIIEDYYAKNPYRVFAPASDLQSKFLKLTNRQVYEAVTADLLQRGIISKKGSKIGLADRKPTLRANEAQAIERIESIFKNAGYSTPLEDEVNQQVETDARTFGNLMTLLLDQGKLVRLNDKVTYHVEYYAKSRKIVVDYINAHGSVTAAELRDKLDVTRKYAIALLEFFDKVLLTKRDGDKRVLK